MSSKFELVNRTGYDTGDLKRFFAKGLRAMKVRTRGKPLFIFVVAAPARSRGCAEVKGHRMVIALASPSHLSMRRLARLFMHETAHIQGLDHDDMPRDLLLSLGSIPSWARGFRLRYRGKAPNQMLFLRR